MTPPRQADPAGPGLPGSSVRSRARGWAATRSKKWALLPKKQRPFLIAEFEVVR